MKHTPGPWKVEVHGNEDHEFHFEVFENHTNAHLIAAAPEMLESLRAVVRVMGDDPTFDHCKRIIASRR